MALFEYGFLWTQHDNPLCKCECVITLVRASVSSQHSQDADSAIAEVAAAVGVDLEAVQSMSFTAGEHSAKLPVGLHLLVWMDLREQEQNDCIKGPIHS